MKRQASISIWQVSAILHLTSSPLKLCQVSWGQIHIFKFLQKYLIGFKLSLWLGHSRTFRVICKPLLLCLGSLSCWKVIFLPSLGFWMLWTRFSLRLSLYFGELRFSSTLMCPSVPAAEKNSPIAWGCYQHTLLLGWYSAAVEQSWFLSHMMLRIKVQQTREYCFSQSELGGSFRCCFANCKKYVFTCLHWGEDWVWPDHHKDWIGGVLRWCLSFCRFLLSPHTIMELN